MFFERRVLKNIDVFSALIKQNYLDVLYVFIIHFFWLYFSFDGKMNANLYNTSSRGVFRTASSAKHFILIFDKPLNTSLHGLHIPGSVTLSWEQFNAVITLKSKHMKDSFEIRDLVYATWLIYLNPLTRQTFTLSTAKRSEICSNLAIKTLERPQSLRSVIIGNF